MYVVRTGKQYGNLNWWAAEMGIAVLITKTYNAGCRSLGPPMRGRILRVSCSRIMIGSGIRNTINLYTAAGAVGHMWPEGSSC